MNRSRDGAVLLAVAIILVPFYVGGDLPEPTLPTGEVLMSTDKECYCVGETVNITATGWAGVPNIGDFPYIFWAITNESGEAVFETVNLLDATGGFNGTLNGTWNQTYRFPYGDPLHGEQVPLGTYTIWFYEIPGPNGPVPGWIPTEADIVECDGPVADAGPDQTVYEGDTVQFNGTGSYSQGGDGGEWSPRAGVPALTWGIGSATLNGEIYYAGGNTFDPAIFPTSTFMKYNTATDSWHNLTNLPTPRAHLGLAALNGKVYAMGGSNGNQSVNTTYEYDPATDAWTAKTPMPLQMESFGVAVVNDRIYTVGGWSTWLLCYPCGEVFEYDPASDTWSMKPGLPTPRAFLAVTVLEDVIYAIGGDSYGALSAVEVYDPIAETWSTRANMSLPRSGLSAETLGGNIYAYGGTNEWGIATDLNEMYDPILDTWSARPSMLEPRVYFGSGAADNCIYAMAGLYGPLIVGFPNSTETYCLDSELEYAWDFDSSVDADGDGNFTNDLDATGSTPIHIYGDDGLYVVTLTVTDESGLSDWDICNITVLNIAPSMEGAQYNINASFAFRIAGEKWHNVEIYLYEDGTEAGYASITRYPGSPNEQMADLGEFSIDFSKTYSAVAYYTPEDDPINGQIWGATPAWVILDYEDGEERIHHTFNVRHEDTWTWVIDDFSPYFLGHNITFMATASDPGSDDLTFSWDWGDGNTTENVYYNNGVGPDPYPSPEVNPITVTDTVQYSFATSGTHVITLTVTDDDGGTETLTLVLGV